MNRIFRALSRRMNRISRAMTPAQVITLIFAAIVVLGACLLCLPCASRTGESCGFLTALFTSTSATCVTGLALVDTFTQWSGFGQVVLLLLIQVGGLGFMTIFSLFLLMLNAKLGLKKRMILQQTFGLTDIRGVVQLLRQVILVTAVTELGCAVVLCLRFLRDFPLKSAVWMGLFHSVSAFCNAGFDILGRISPGCSLSPFAGDPLVLCVVMFEIVLGGLGFFVWQDLWFNRRSLKSISVYTRLALCATGILLLGGAFVFGACEWTNPATLGAMGPGRKLLNAVFQSVTTRTAGFATFSQGAMTDAGKAASCIWMLIGGCSGSTAGGMKTVTVAVLLMSAINTARGKANLTVFHRRISPAQIAMAQAIVTLVASLALIGAVILSAGNGIPFVDALFETASALGTVGLTADVTPSLHALSQIMIIIFMFFGRVGIMTISLGFLMGNRAEDRIRYAETKLMIG